MEQGGSSAAQAAEAARLILAYTGKFTGVAYATPTTAQGMSITFHTAVQDLDSNY
jgi:hypothetical protein